MFSVVKRAIADVEPFEYMPGAEGLTLGSAAKISSGALAKCAATDTVGFIIAGAKREDGTYPVIRALPTTIFETTASAAIANTKIGTTLQLNSTADGVTSTASGSFMVTHADGGTTVQGYFVDVAAAG